MEYLRAFIIIVAVLIIGAITITAITGAGSFKRMVKISGIYSVCKPDGYDVVCFMDADSHQGGTFCLPLSSASKTGECKK